FCKRALALDPHCSTAYVRMAEVYDAMERPIEEMESLDLAIEVALDASVARDIREVQVTHANITIEILTRKLEAAEVLDRPSMLPASSRCWIALGDRDGARADAGASMFASRGRCWLALGDVDKARADAHAAIAREPQCADAGRLLAMIAIHVDDWETARM